MGRAAAIAFARHGADVAINYFPTEEPDAQEVVALIKAERPVGVPISGDLREEKFCQDDLIARAETNIFAPFWIIKAANRIGFGQNRNQENVCNKVIGGREVYLSFQIDHRRRRGWRNIMKNFLLATVGLVALGAAAPASAADLAGRPYTKAPPMVAAVSISAPTAAVRPVHRPGRLCLGLLSSRYFSPILNASENSGMNGNVLAKLSWRKLVRCRQRTPLVGFQGNFLD
jgi:hypothetical protein